MKQILIKPGKAVLEEVPAPQVESGTILVCVKYSCISIGTEMSGLKSSETPLWKRALKEPKKVKKVLEMAAMQGISKTHKLIKNAVSSGQPTGYSAAGIVLEIGEGVEDIVAGDYVACAGAQCAYHAEIIRIPRNLAVKIPENVNFKTASTVTLGAIALQGVRRAQPTLGETFVIIGLGIIGQITAQILKANGCRTIGTDIDPERVHMAEKMGLDMGLYPDCGNQIEQVARMTDGIGCDGVIITAATPSHKVVSTAFQMCRKKGRVVLVGDVGLNLNRSDFYQKELDFFISTSYGPGRYDNVYEENGLDYPVSYVRWTENRNMLEYLRLLSQGNVQVDPLIDKIYPIEKATEAYESLKENGQKPLLVLLSYPDDGEQITIKHTIPNPKAKPVNKKCIRIAVIGAGSFAKGMHLPNLQALPDDYHIQAIVSRTGHNAQNSAIQFGANYASTDYRQVLDDSEVDAVLIATRHNLHAEMVLEALIANKHVLVEKPLCLKQRELDTIVNFYNSKLETPSFKKPILMTGFNRRFSPYMRRIKEIVINRSNPMIINYRINAGYIPLNHWVHTEEGGGRNIGEACHIYDLFTYLTEARVINVHAQAITPITGHYSRKDNFVVTITFDDGSVATLTYTALGNKDYPKEKMDVYVDGKVLIMDDYRNLIIHGAKIKGVQTKFSEKGQKAEILAYAKAIKMGGEWPITLWEQIQATEIALQVENYLGGTF
jgi:predicted dehydrogenase